MAIRRMRIQVTAYVYRFCVPYGARDFGTANPSLRRLQADPVGRGSFKAAFRSEMDGREVAEIVVNVTKMTESVRLGFMNESYDDRGGSFVIDAWTVVDGSGEGRKVVMICEFLQEQLDRRVRRFSSSQGTAPWRVSKETVSSFLTSLLGQLGNQLHNDISPSNVMYKEAGGSLDSPMLIDFGFAAEVRSDRRW